MSWVFKNVVILIETIVMDVLMTLVKKEKTLSLLSQVNISRNTVSLFENVVILMATMVMEDLMLLVKLEQTFSLFNQA